MPRNLHASAPRPTSRRSPQLATMRNPKRGATERQGIHSWLPYYAGFAESFVEDALRSCLCDASSIVLDPMNGSGTTTVAAQRYGCLSIGFDLNPVMAIIANSKDASLRDAAEINAAARDIVLRVGSQPISHKGSKMGPWLSARAAAQLNKLLELISELPATAPPVPRLLKAVSGCEALMEPGIKAFLLAAVVITTRSIATTRRSKNPTWVKPAPRTSRTAIDVPDAFLRTVARMQADLTKAFPKPPQRRGFLVGTADARALPVVSNSVDAIVTSPPYLTRIDYAVSTAPELALLGHSTAAALRSVRASLMGSTCITHGPYEISSSWGKQCAALIDAVRRHRSKSSASYYAKTFIQYFRDAEKIVQEYRRVLKPGRYAAIVVQDSWYKDMPIPLGAIYVEMAQQAGFQSASLSQSNPVRSHLGLVNTRARAYSKGHINEHIVVLQK